MHSILFVDDDLAVLTSLQELFTDKDVEQFFAADSENALAVMESHDIEMVLSDIRMPRTNGHRLLHTIKEQYPSSVRIIMGESTWENECHQAVLDGSAKLYLLKPFESRQVLDTVTNLFAFKDSLQSKNMLDIIGTIDQLPAVTDIYTRVCRLVESDAPIAEIASVIEEDPAISAKILQLINSVYFNKKISSLKQAIAYLGLNAIKNLVLTTSIFNYVSSKSTDYFNQMFSRQAILTTVILEFIYEAFLGKKLPDNYLTAGLLHDLGMVVMQQHFTSRYLNAFRVCSLQELPFLLGETEAFGVNHQSIGGYLLEWWGIPYPIVESCLCHHDPLSSSVHRELVCAVHLADYYAWTYLGREDLVRLDAGVFDVLQLEREKCDQVISETLLGWEEEYAQ